jgi:hypothetical protein
MIQLFGRLPNPDKNFIREFQTEGFDSRVWELYLFGLSQQVGLQATRPHDRPDFLFTRNGVSVWLEAVTSHAGKDVAPMIPDEDDPGYQDSLRQRYGHFLPKRLGSTLYSKLTARYWELDHVRGRPLVIAIEDFHDADPFRDSSSSLMRYLYARETTIKSAQGYPLELGTRPIQTHAFGSSAIPSGFFDLPGAENVSAVLFSNSGTVPKFNRIGYDKAWHSTFRLLRIGTRVDHDDNAIVPAPFSYVVGYDSHEEDWEEGLEIFHNPRARYPVPDGFFGCSMEHHPSNGTAYGGKEQFHPLMSVTEVHPRSTSIRLLRKRAHSFVADMTAAFKASEPAVRTHFGLQT